MQMNFLGTVAYYRLCTTLHLKVSVSVGAVLFAETYGGLDNMPKGTLFTGRAVREWDEGKVQIIELLEVQ